MYLLLRISDDQRKHALERVADGLRRHAREVFSANRVDVDNARDRGIPEQMIDRLVVDEARLEGEIESVRSIAAQEDVAGKLLSQSVLYNGMQVNKVCFPLGIVSIIYESRPLVTVDAFAIAFKSGNAILLRGSKTAAMTNLKLVEIIKESLEETEPRLGDCVELLAARDDYNDVDEILGARGKIDCVIPRGGRNLIQNVVNNAKVPVIETGAGVCHAYIDEFADLDMALKIVENAKLSRPSVCNALECVVVHEKVRGEFIPRLQKLFDGRCEILLEQVETNWGVEWLDKKLSVKFVNTLEEAVEFINAHNTKHSETIISTDTSRSRYFQQNVDAACVYVNSSTRFTDGAEFGLGAELGISTQKLHARGPMGVTALTTYKYLIEGDGQIRE
jgi:glutamate-5-semialdehyde dehydrogenase